MDVSSTKVPGKTDNYTQQEPQFLTPEEKQLSVVLNAFNYSRSFYSYRYLKFRQWLRLYNRIPDTKPPFRSNLFIPKIYSLLSTVLPRLVANSPTFRFLPRKEQDEEAIDQMSTLIKYQMDRMDFTKKLRMWVKDCLMFGVGVAKVFWNRDDKVEINDVDMTVVDLFDFFPDPKATQIQAGDFMIHRTIMPISELKRAKSADGKPLYKDLDKILDSTNEENSNKLFLTNDRSMTIGDIDARLILGTPYRQSLTKQVELLEYWGIFTEGDDEWCITVANRNRVIRAQKNDDKLYSGKRPFVKMEIDPQNFLFYGTGIIGPLEDLQIQKNDTRNQRMDNVNLILNKLFVVLKDADVNEQELVSRPGGVIYEGTPNGVRVLETPDITQSAYQEEAMLDQDMEETIGVTDIIQGQLQDSEGSKNQVINKTATGAKIAAEQAGSRFKYYLQNVEDSLKEFGQKMYEYNQQFMSEQKVIRVEAPNDYEAIQKQGLLGKIKGMIGLPQQAPSKFQFVKIRPDTIRNLDLDVKVESGSTQPIEESLKQEKIMNLLQIIGQLPVTTPQTYMALAEEVLKAYQVADKDKILKTLQVPQGTPPKASVSVSLKGDLNPFEVGDIAKTLGASPQSTDPQLAAHLMAQDKSDELQNEIIKHGAKGAVDSQLAAQQHQQTLQQQQQAGMMQQQNGQQQPGQA